MHRFIWCVYVTTLYSIVLSKICHKSKNICDFELNSNSSSFRPSYLISIISKPPDSTRQHHHHHHQHDTTYEHRTHQKKQKQKKSLLISCVGPARNQLKQIIQYISIYVLYKRKIIIHNNDRHTIVYFRWIIFVYDERKRRSENILVRSHYVYFMYVCLCSSLYDIL